MSDADKLWMRQLSETGPEAQREYDRITRSAPDRFKLRTVRGLKAPGWIVVVVEYGDVTEVQRYLKDLGYEPFTVKPNEAELAKNPWS